MHSLNPELVKTWTLEQVWHVLDVLENSPAESAGLVPFGDWIVGWSGGPLARERDFYEVIEAVSIVSHRLCTSKEPKWSTYCSDLHSRYFYLYDGR